MPVKWKLFAVANYIMLSFYLYQLVYFLRFTVEVLPGDESISTYIPYLLTLISVIINSGFSIYIFHKHVPDKPLNKTIRTFYLISSILFTIALISFLVMIGYLINNVFKSNDPAGKTLLQVVFLFNLSIGLFVLISQFLLPKSLERNHRRKFLKPEVQ